MVNKTVLISLRAYARHRGCSLAAVQKAISSGRIMPIGGKIDAKLADREWAANTDPMQWWLEQRRRRCSP